MATLEKLILEQLTAEVGYQTLGSLVDISNNGVDKVYKVGEREVFLINFLDVYNNRTISAEVLNSITTASDSKIRSCNVLKGDLFITPTSEVVDDIGHVAFVDSDISDAVFSYHVMRLRILDQESVLPEYLRYVLHSSKIKSQITKSANGITRFGLTKRKWESLRIPIPPLTVQAEIVKILSTIEALIESLEAEMKARLKQLSFSKSLLHTTSETQNEKCLADIATFSDTRINKSELPPESYVGVENLLPNFNGKSPLSASQKSQAVLTKYEPGDILIGNIRPYLKKVWLSDCEGGASGDVLVIRIREEAKNYLSNRFLYCLLSSDEFINYATQHSKGAGMPRGDKKSIMKFKFSIPSLSEQDFYSEGILAISEALVDIIPAEIIARKKQLAYCSDALLSFKENSI